MDNPNPKQPRVNILDDSTRDPDNWGADNLCGCCHRYPCVCDDLEQQAWKQRNQGI